MTSFEKIREIRGKQNEGFQLEAKTIKDGKLKSEDSEDEEHFRNSRMT